MVRAESVYGNRAVRCRPVTWRDLAAALWQRKASARPRIATARVSGGLASAALSLCTA